MLSLLTEPTPRIMPPHAPSHLPAVEILTRSVAEWPGRWTLLQSSTPRATQLDLRDHWNTPAYVPTYQASVVYNERRRWEERVLFPGYCIAKAFDDVDVSWRRVRGVWGHTNVEDSMQDQLTDELTGVERMLAANPKLRRASDIMPGARVRICDGPLIGLEGTVVRIDSDCLFALHVPMLGVALLEKVPERYLEPI